MEIWSDMVCPWCYIAKHRFDNALSGFEHRKPGGGQLAQLSARMRHPSRTRISMIPCRKCVRTARMKDSNTTSIEGATATRSMHTD
ncbi:hypothetical protein [Mesorhizobium montanum]|uniref:hypothetical protein n=1 Tax=Mesorhizobium montanum TaxID=3072323 RepID=UPI003D321648